MQSDGKVRHKLKQVLYRHLQRRIRLGLRKHPSTCRHNTRVVSEGRVLGFARCQVDGSRVCDECLVGGTKTARNCGDWSPRQTKEEIRGEFEALCSQGRAHVAFQFPDAGALMWVLGEDIGYTLPPADEPDVEGPDEPADEPGEPDEPDVEEAHPTIATPPEMPPSDPLPVPDDLPTPEPSDEDAPGPSQTEGPGT